MKGQFMDVGKEVHAFVTAAAAARDAAKKVREVQSEQIDAEKTFSRLLCESMQERGLTRLPGGTAHHVRLLPPSRRSCLPPTQEGLLALLEGISVETRDIPREQLKQAIVRIVRGRALVPPSADARPRLSVVRRPISEQATAPAPAIDDATGTLLARYMEARGERTATRDSLAPLRKQARHARAALELTLTKECSTATVVATDSGVRLRWEPVPPAMAPKKLGVRQFIRIVREVVDEIVADASIDRGNVFDSELRRRVVVRIDATLRSTECRMRLRTERLRTPSVIDR